MDINLLMDALNKHINDIRKVSDIKSNSFFTVFSSVLPAAFPAIKSFNMTLCLICDDITNTIFSESITKRAVNEKEIKDAKKELEFNFLKKLFKFISSQEFRSLI